MSFVFFGSISFYHPINVKRILAGLMDHVYTRRDEVWGTIIDGFVGNLEKVGDMQL